MARPLRIQYPDACYHVMNRGNRGEDIFVTDSDRVTFTVRFNRRNALTGHVFQGRFKSLGEKEAAAKRGA